MGGCMSAPKAKTPAPTPVKSKVQSPKEHEKVKICLAGEGDAGKTTLCKTWMYGSASATTPTVELDCYEKEVTVEGDPVVIELWDTGGQERFRSITSSYYRAAEALIIVFDQTYDFGRTTIVRWMEEAQRYCHSQIVVAVVANKKDIATAEETFKEVQAYQKTFDIGFFSISALSGESVDHVIQQVFERVLQVREHGDGLGTWGDF